MVGFRGGGRANLCATLFAILYGLWRVCGYYERTVIAAAAAAIAVALVLLRGCGLSRTRNDGYTLCCMARVFIGNGFYGACKSSDGENDWDETLNLFRVRYYVCVRACVRACICTFARAQGVSGSRRV